MPPLRRLNEVEPAQLQNRADHWQHFKTGDFGEKWNSSKVIVKEGQGAIAPLLTLLSDPTADAETHWFTIRALGHFPEPEVIAAIAAQIDDNSAYTSRTAEQAAELSAFAIETLAAMGTLAIDVLAQLLTNPKRRQLAAKALNRVRSIGVIPHLVQVANDGDELVRYYAIDALGSFHNAAVTPVLLKALQDPATTVRKTAVMALGRRSDLQRQHPLSQRLIPLLWDIDLRVSCQAALALGRLGSQEAIEPLQRVLLSDLTPTALRIDAVRALAWYCDRAPSPQAPATVAAFTALTHALQAFSMDKEPSAPGSPDTHQIQGAIIRVLGDLKQSSLATAATAALIQQLQTQPAPTLVQTIAMALASLDQPQSFDALLPLLRHPSDAVPIHTIAALKRLDPQNSLQRATAYLKDSPQDSIQALALW